MKQNEKSLSFFRIGCSSAASWAWGTSLIMGQQIAQEKGLIAWIIWAVCNTLTLALFGWLHKRKAIDPDVYNRKEFKVVALIIQLFCLLVQLNFINQQFSIITGNPTLSYIITVALGFIFTLMVYRKGLPTSVFTDVIQWLMAFGAVIVIICLGISTHAPKQVFVPTSSSGVLWGVWSGLILFAGPIGDVQHWQRAEADKSKKAYYLGSVLFGLYMLGILGMAFFQFTMPMHIILLVAVLGVTTSTIDSIAVAMHELGNKKVGTGISLALCVAFGLFVKMGMIQLWSSFGVIRFAFAVGILLMPYALKAKKSVVIPFALLSFMIMIIFSVLGQITINSVAGVVSVIIATAILVYIIVQVARGKEWNTKKISI